MEIALFKCSVQYNKFKQKNACKQNCSKTENKKERKVDPFASPTYSIYVK